MRFILICNGRLGINKKGRIGEYEYKLEPKISLNMKKKIEDQEMVFVSEFDSPFPSH
jgi:hypothetical protein